MLRARLLVPVIAAVPLVLGSACSSGGGAPTSALLLTLDTTRTDAVSAYDTSGSGPEITPVLDRLASEGVIFDAAFTVAPLTLPSHASMLTGLVPLRHTVRDNDFWPVPSSATTLAEIASEAGFETAAFIAAAVLNAPFGLAQGFGTYDVPPNVPQNQGQHYVERSAAAVVDAALRWFEGRDPERPFFVWCHFYDPHAPYAPRSPEMRKRFPRSPYHAEVAEMDRQIGRLLDYLADEGLKGSTAVLAVSDHGESFGEHDETGHGANVYQTTIGIPFILRLPDSIEGVAPGTRRSDVVSVVDVLPTLADVLGLRAPAGIDGVSLLAPPQEGRGAYFESYGGLLSFGYSHVAGWVSSTGKYVHSSSPQFFDLATDPDELQDLAPTNGSLADPHRAAIRELAGLSRLEPDGRAGPTQEELDSLRALGYAGLGAAEGDVPEPLDKSDRPSPARMTAYHGKVLAAIDIVKSGRFEEGAQKLQVLLQRHPRSPAALENLGYALLQLQRFSEAILPLERLAIERPGMALTRYNLGVCYWSVERKDEAIAAVRSAVELEPNPRFVQTLVLFLEETGRAAEAQEARRMLTPGR